MAKTDEVKTVRKIASKLWQDGQEETAERLCRDIALSTAKTTYKRELELMKKESIVETTIKDYKETGQLLKRDSKEIRKDIGKLTDKTAKRASKAVNKMVNGAGRVAYEISNKTGQAVGGLVKSFINGYNQTNK